MMVKINKWVPTGGNVRVGGFTWGEQRLEKVLLDTDLLDISGGMQVKRVYGFPYDMVNIPYKQAFKGSFSTDSESFRKLVKVIGDNAVEI